MHKKILGFTLVELLIGIILVGIISSLGVLVFPAVLSEKKLKLQSIHLLLFLKSAKAQAIQTAQTQVVLFAENDQEWCYKIVPFNVTHINCETTLYKGETIDKKTLTFSENIHSKISFAAGTGFTKTGSIHLSNKNKTTSLLLSNTGRVRLCTSDSILGISKC